MITFFSPNELDPAAFSIMGLSAKEGENSIGRFGTGLKFAIATLLRHGAKIRIHSGDNHYDFDSTPESFRGKEFRRVTCNGQPLGYTTDLGSTWKLWMAYRELYCNALDEGGGVTVLKSDALTRIFVSNCPDFMSVHNMRSQWFIQDEWTPFYEDENVAVYNQPNTRLFCQGIAVAENQMSLFTWNFKKSMDLTEDRVLADLYRAYSLAGKAAAQFTNKTCLKQVLLVEGSYFESSLGYFNCSPSKECAEVAKDIYKKTRNIPSYLKQAIETKWETSFIKEVLFTSDEVDMLACAIAHLKNIGVEITCPIVKIEEIGNVLGAHKDGKIMLTSESFTHGMHSLVCTLFEEQRLHADLGMIDESRTMQDWLLRSLITEKLKKVGVFL